MPETSITSETRDAAREPHRAGLVALVGLPNSGKSTLLNRLVGTKVAIVSDKPQTTRHRIRGVVTRDRGQAVFVDTPGVHRPHYEMNRRMMEATRDTLSEVDAVALLVDTDAPIGRGVEFTISLLEGIDTPVVLLLNKVDLLEKPKLLPMIDDFRQRHDFAEIVPISALRGDNCDAFLEAVLELLPAGPPLFPDDSITDRPARFLVAELVREKILAATREELPYSTAVTIDTWDGPDDEDGVVEIGATIWVDKESHKPIVIGSGGRVLKAVGREARAEIEELIGRHVYLELWVKVRPGWREQPRMLERLEIE